jgi:RNA polymerase sigma-70 factor (ECF subfamily)
MDDRGSFHRSSSAVSDRKFRVTILPRSQLGRQTFDRGNDLPSHPLPHPAQAAGPDSRTINRAKLGDIAAFTEIVEAYYPRCLRFARAMLHDPDDAADTVQETFVRVYRALPRYEERQRFESWLFQILGNCCRTANTVHQRHASRVTNDDAALERIPAEASAESIDHEWSEEVRRALARVPEYNREIFLLHYVEGFSYEEIERMTGVRQSALKMRVKRAADALRRQLAREAS